MLLTCAFRNVARFAGAFRRAPAVWESLAGRSLHKAADSAQRLLAADVKRHAAEAQARMGVTRADQIMAASIARQPLPGVGNFDPDHLHYSIGQTKPAKPAPPPKVILPAGGTAGRAA